MEFIKADVTEIAEVDRVCAEIQKKEKKINLLFQTQGNLNMRGRDGEFFHLILQTRTLCATKTNVSFQQNLLKELIAKCPSTSTLAPALR